MDTCRIKNNKAKCGGYLIVGVDGLNVKDFEEEASMLLERARMLTSVDAELFEILRPIVRMLALMATCGFCFRLLGRYSGCCL